MPDRHAAVRAWRTPPDLVTLNISEEGAIGQLAREIDARVAPLGRPRVWHGDARANWAVVDAGAAAGVDVRVGLEDTIVGRRGEPAPGNAAQVADLISRAA